MWNSLPNIMQWGLIATRSKAKQFPSESVWSVVLYGQCHVALLSRVSGMRPMSAHNKRVAILKGRDKQTPLVLKAKEVSTQRWRWVSRFLPSVLYTMILVAWSSKPMSPETRSEAPACCKDVLAPRKGKAHFPPHPLAGQQRHWTLKDPCVLDTPAENSSIAQRPWLSASNLAPSQGPQIFPENGELGGGGCRACDLTELSLRRSTPPPLTHCPAPHWYPLLCGMWECGWVTYVRVCIHTAVCAHTEEHVICIYNTVLAVPWALCTSSRGASQHMCVSVGLGHHRVGSGTFLFLL